MRTVALVTVSLGIVLSIASAAPAARSVAAGSAEPVRLTFRAGSSICLAHPDGTQRRRFVRVTTHSISGVTWSPKGKYAALIRGGSRTGADLVVADERGHTLRHLIRHFSYPPDDPVWSPDGRWIAVEGGGHGGSIGVVPASGGGWAAWHMLWATPTLSDGLDSPTWTADSRRLAFTVGFFNPIPFQESGVYTIGIDRSDFRLLIPGGYTPAYSPDGSQLAYVRAGDIWVSDADGTNPRHVTTGGADGRPAWSPRGRLIAFERTIAGHTSIYAVKPDGSGERVLVSSPRYDATMPSWRPPARFRGGPRRPCP